MSTVIFLTLTTFNLVPLRYLLYNSHERRVIVTAYADHFHILCNESDICKRSSRRTNPNPGSAQHFLGMDIPRPDQRSHWHSLGVLILKNASWTQFQHSSPRLMRLRTSQEVVASRGPCIDTYLKSFRSHAAFHVFFMEIASIIIIECIRMARKHQTPITLCQKFYLGLYIL